MDILTIRGRGFAGHDLAQAGSRSISIWLDQTDAVGLIQVEAPELEADALPATAARLAEHLRGAGYDAVLAEQRGSELSGLLVASADTTEEKHVCQAIIQTSPR